MAAGEWDEEKHPRDATGEFTESSGADEGGTKSSDRRTIADTDSIDSYFTGIPGYASNVEEARKQSFSPISLTAREVGVLQRWHTDEYSAGDPYGSTWTRYFCGGRFKGDSGLVSSLVQKGLLFADGVGKEASLSLTDLGRAVFMRLPKEPAKRARKLKAAMTTPRTLAEIIAAGDWDESKHPRDERGRFGEGGGGQSPTAAHQAPILDFLRTNPNATPSEIRRAIAPKEPFDYMHPAEHSVHQALMSLRDSGTIEYIEPPGGHGEGRFRLGNTPKGYAKVTPTGRTIPPPPGDLHESDRDRAAGVLGARLNSLEREGYRVAPAPLGMKVTESEALGPLPGNKVKQLLEKGLTLTKQPTPRRRTVKAEQMTPRTLAEIIAAGDWDESKHPRDERGKFTEGGGGTGGGGAPAGGTSRPSAPEYQPHPGPSRSEHQKQYDALQQARDERAREGKPGRRVGAPGTQRVMHNGEPHDFHPLDNVGPHTYGYIRHEKGPVPGPTGELPYLHGYRDNATGEFAPLGSDRAGEMKRRESAPIAPTLHEAPSGTLDEMKARDHWRSRARDVARTYIGPGVASPGDRDRAAGVVAQRLVKEGMPSALYQHAIGTALETFRNDDEEHRLRFYGRKPGVLPTKK